LRHLADKLINNWIKYTVS